ncbi:hypothetical protein [Pseudothauera rhizosphaerae]|uniref:Uncharacterized protein n=1 Tax=Pseudothauera rhizosphaerae TaxID=2565932 RepID=A0A4S4AZ06_9RHOO|nr:hypothetical protein [Pseudothauera rhizosphaerae]THF65243.1 hypothetical protein E6O51_01185 [Pseudothauera rhizosphaerae]
MTQATTSPPPMLDRPAVVAAIADYLMEANHGGYRPDARKVLTVRKSDRRATVREAAAPVRGEVFYFIEGELFSRAEATRLGDGESPLEGAERLVDEIWDRLWVWNAYDFARSTSGWKAP